jgi:hypothetical protein
MTMIGQSEAQTIIQNTRLSKNGVGIDTSALCGPSLYKCRCEYVTNPKQAPKSMKRLIKVVSVIVFTSHQLCKAIITLKM